MHWTALVRGALERASQGGDGAGVLIGDDQPHPGQTALVQRLVQRGEEAPPEHLVLTVSPLSPRSSPRTSRPPSAVMPVATTTAIDTTWEVPLRTCK